MVATLDTTQFGALLKTLYPKDKVSLLGYAENAFFAMVPKMEDFGGDSMKVAVRVGGTQGNANTFATAQANVYSQNQYAFIITRGKMYGVARIDGETLDASVGNEKAFISALTDTMDRCILSVSEDISQALYGNGFGVLAQGDSAYAVGAAAITLASAEDSIKFWPGMVLKLDAAATGASVRAGTVTVSIVDRINGIVTCTGNVTAGIAAAVNSDYIFREGSVANGLKGLAAWIPAGSTRTAQLAASFFSVTRSLEPAMLGGIVYDGSGRSVEEAILKAASLSGRFGAQPKYAFMSFDVYSDLIASLGSKIMFTNGGVKAFDANIYFPAVRIWTPAGVIEAIGDRMCPSNRIYLLNLDEWKLASLGKAPKILNQDGNQMLRIAAEDGIEIRIGLYGQLICSAPGHATVITL